MPTVDELLAKQAKRLQRMQEKEIAEKPPLRLERQGPTRPWQEHLPQYQNGDAHSTIAMGGDVNFVDLTNTRAQNKAAQGMEPPSLQSCLQAADSKIDLAEASAEANQASPAYVTDNQRIQHTQKRHVTPARDKAGKSVGASNAVASANDQAKLQTSKTKSVSRCRTKNERGEAKAGDPTAPKVQRPHPPRFQTKGLLQKNRHTGVDTKHTADEQRATANQKGREGGSGIAPRASSHSLNSSQRPRRNKSTVTKRAQNYSSTMAQKDPNHGSTMAQKDLNHGSTMAQKGLNHGSTMAQKDPDHGSTMAQKDPDHGSTMAQKDPNHGSTMAQKDPNHGSTMAQKDPNHGSTMAQK
ncbi:MAG: hypothetical protein EOO38_00340, partial [Cytophagaceae bacterium]